MKQKILTAVASALLVGLAASAQADENCFEIFGGDALACKDANGVWYIKPSPKL